MDPPRQARSLNPPQHEEPADEDSDRHPEMHVAQNELEPVALRRLAVTVSHGVAGLEGIAPADGAQYCRRSAAERNVFDCVPLERGLILRGSKGSRASRFSRCLSLERFDLVDPLDPFDP